MIKISKSKRFEKKKNTPEMDLCDKLGIQMLWGIGGKDKPQSSSWLVDKLREKK